MFLWRNLENYPSIMPVSPFSSGAVAVLIRGHNGMVLWRNEE